MNCRHCKKLLSYTFVDLGFAPPSNAYLSEDDLTRPEIYYPLKIKVCDQCWLVQTEDYADADSLFTPDYAYFSSTSSSFLLHAKDFSSKIIKDLSLNEKSMVIEVASNDGYLLKNFLSANIPCLGIEPTKSTAEAAEKLNIPVEKFFFTEALGKQLASEGKQADLIIGNNVYGHVPDINDFTKGLKNLLKPEGTITLEFPHLMNLIEQTQFDTIYHEHFSYLSLHTVSRIFSSFGLRVWDVEKLSTHGGSLRIYGCHENDKRKTKKTVEILLEDEISFKLKKLETYLNFQTKVNKIKDNLVSFLIEQKRTGKKVAAYGAAAKGNTLLNYAGIKPDLISTVFDGSKSKQDKFMPGSHILIQDPKNIKALKPDCIIILPWNIYREIKKKICFFYTKEIESKSINDFKSNIKKN
jgi:2-polyprenyl-3-methyl-5-hydroxy-6-metoxy-1,4-benzoquinol methylase